MTPKELENLRSHIEKMRPEGARLARIKICTKVLHRRGILQVGLMVWVKQKGDWMCYDYHMPIQLLDAGWDAITMAQVALDGVWRRVRAKLQELGYSV